MTVDSRSPQSPQGSPEPIPLDTLDHAVEAGLGSGSRIISKVLTPAVRLWLRSQVEQVDELTVQIEGSDRQILSGSLDRVVVAAESVVYQGLSLSHIRIEGSQIRVNLGQVLRGKPLRLLQPIPVDAVIEVSEADLNASLQTPLLAQAMNDFWAQVWQSLQIDLSAAASATDSLEPPPQIPDPRLRIETDRLTITTLSPDSSTLLILNTGFVLSHPQELQLHNPQRLPHMQATQGKPLPNLHGFPISLGTDVAIADLTLAPQRLTCQGRITIVPA